MSVKKQVKSLLGKLGIKIIRYPDRDMKNRMKLLSHYKVDTVFDIGANAGQYSKMIRNLGYVGKIVSFEPLASVFKELKINASKDNNWVVNNCALGDEDGETTINVSGFSQASSMLEMHETHIDFAPITKYIDKETIQIKQLDTIYGDFVKQGNNVMLKLDVQGFEKNVLDGGANSLKKVALVELEMCITELYKGQMLYKDLIDHMFDLGFDMVGWNNGGSHLKTGKLLWSDAIFANRNL